MANSMDENMLEELARNGSTLSQKELKQIQFAEYLKKMGMREYDNKNIFFYIEELDIKKKAEKQDQSLSQTEHSLQDEELDYDVEMINELFDPNPEKQIRISREFRNKDGFNSLFYDQRGNDAMGNEAFDLNALNIDMLTQELD